MYSDQLPSFFQAAQEHRTEHQCGGYPYLHGDILTTLVAAIQPQLILEVGTGIGYTAACFVYGNEQALIDTVDQDSAHLVLAQRHWEDLAIQNQITVYAEKAEAVLPSLTKTYDMIFFDGYAPSMKFLIHFERLLKKGGLLITANLFVKDVRGGRYLRAMQKERKWKTGIFDDTAISVKLFS